jgi:bis(5'-adenosyl)-triphosphatase
MVIPKQPRQRVEDMSQDEIADLLLTARHIGSKLEKHFNCTSINFSIQDGPEAGQSVKVIRKSSKKWVVFMYN